MVGRGEAELEADRADRVWQAATVSRVESLVSFFGEQRTDPRPTVPARPDLTPAQRALIAEACSKSSVSWVRPLDDARPHLAWHAWHDEAMHLVHGVGEQLLPMLAGHVEVRVPSKVDRSLLVTFVAAATVLAPQSPAWQEAVAALAGVRLNAVDDATTQAERWATGGMVIRLEPITVLAQGPGDRDAPSGASTPPENPGVTVTRRPWHLGGRRRRSG